MLRLGLLLLLQASIFASLLTCAGCGNGKQPEILLLVRAGDPVSRAIADYYAAEREVPANRILELELSGEPGKSEIDSATFLREIADPVERYLAQADTSGKIGILITTRGLPLRIGHCSEDHPSYPRDCRSAAVDAALAQLGRIRDKGPAFAREANPFYRDPRSFEQFRNDEPDARLRFLVARLTASADARAGTPEMSDTSERTGSEAGDAPIVLREMIDRKPAAPSQIKPLWQVLSDSPPGKRTAAEAALLDPVEARLPLLGHRVCDGCPREPGEELAAAGVVLHTDTSLEGGERLSYPGIVIGLPGMSTERHARPGGSDQTAAPASPFDRFVNHWIALGAGAISTHIADPSLAGVVRPATQLAALARGHSAIEAYFQSLPQLGWMNVFVGDPLLTLDEAALFEDEGDDRDGDGIADSSDNCRDDPNPDQRDTNGDRLGNRCDPDVDGDGLVDTSWGAIYPVDGRGDLEAITLTARNGPYDPDHDLDGDGVVDDRDLAIVQLGLFREPGR